MRTSIILVIIINFILLAGGCSNSTIPHKADYSLTTSWFEPESAERGESVDVFYIAPTCIRDSITPKGDTVHFMDISNERQRATVASSIYLGREAFAQDANFYSPYYRQLSLDVLSDDAGDLKKRFDIAFMDIANSFDYYLKHYNQGRPFILAGHSQGAEAVIELIKRRFDDETYSKMVAAYIMGYQVTPADSTECKYLRPALRDDDTGVCVCIISVSDTSVLTTYTNNNCFAINPLNWTTDTTYADKSLHLGAVFLNRDGSISKEIDNMIGVKVEPQKHVLIVDGINPDDYYRARLDAFFKRGNYHVQEIPFYMKNLQENAKLRSESYLKNSGAEK